MEEAVVPVQQADASHVVMGQLEDGPPTDRATGAGDQYAPPTDRFGNSLLIHLQGGPGEEVLDSGHAGRLVEVLHRVDLRPLGGHVDRETPPTGKAGQPVDGRGSDQRCADHQEVDLEVGQHGSQLGDRAQDARLGIQLLEPVIKDGHHRCARCLKIDEEFGAESPVADEQDPPTRIHDALLRLDE